jgi:hypothetical protein
MKEYAYEPEPIGRGGGPRESMEEDIAHCVRYARNTYNFTDSEIAAALRLWAKKLETNPLSPINSKPGRSQRRRKKTKEVC